MHLRIFFSLHIQYLSFFVLRWYFWEEWLHLWQTHRDRFQVFEGQVHLLP